MTRVSDRTFQSRQESTFSADSLSVYGVRTALYLTVFVQLSILRCSCSSLSYCVRTAFRFTVFVQLCLTVFVQLFLTVFVQLSVLRCSYKSLHVLRCSYKSLSYGVRTVLCVIVFVQFSVLLCSYSPVCSRLHQPLCERSQFQAPSGHTKILHTLIGMGGAAR